MRLSKKLPSYRPKRRGYHETEHYEEQDGHRNRGLTFELYEHSFTLGGDIAEVDMESMVIDLVHWTAKGRI